MAEKTYKITADTSQAIKNYQKLLDVMTKVGSMPDSFQKNVYNALNKAQEDIVKYGNDVSKLGIVFSKLNQTINKALDFNKTEVLPSAIKDRIKEITKEADNAATSIIKLQKKTTELSRAVGLTNISINSMKGSITELNKYATATSSKIAVQSNSMTSLANASIKAANDIGKLSLDTERFGSVTRNLENDLTGVGDRVQSLSTKARNAKANIEILRVESSRLKDIYKQLEDVTLEIRGIEKAKANLEDLKNKYKVAIAVSKENRDLLKSLESQYDSNKQKLTEYTNKYKELKKQIDSLKGAGANIPNSLAEAFERTGRAVKDIEQEMKAVEKSIVSAKAKQEQLNATTNNMKNALSRLNNENKMSDGQLAQYREMVLNLESKYRATKEATNAAKAYNSEMAKQSGVLRLVGTQFRSLIYDLNAVRIAFILLSSSTGILSAIKVIADFDKSMARVRSLMIGAEDATSALNVKFQALSDTVMALGATTKFTAGQVAEGAVIITQAGYSAKESIDVLRPTLDLAVAGQIEMSEAADTLTKTIAMFQKQTSEAAHVADVYAAAVNYSQTNMSELANAMTYVGPVAETFGLSLEETAGYLAVLANNGISASKAGTSLRQLMMNIQQPTTKAAQVLNAYGLNLKELQKQGMSAEEALRHILTTLSEANRLGGVVRITALPAAESLGKNNEALEEMLRLLKDIDGYSKKVAENNMDNLADQFIQLVSALQDTIIKFGQFSGLTDGLTNAFKSSADFIRSWNVDIADLITDLGLFGGVLLVARGRWKSYQQAMKEAQSGQVSYNSVISKTGTVFTGFKNKINEVNDSIFKYKQSIQGATLATKTFGTVAKIASMPLVAMTAEMIALTAVMYGISKAVEYFMSNDIDDVLENNADLIKAASQATVEGTKAYTDYKEAIDAVAASARQMNEIQLTGKIEETKQEIEQLQPQLEKVLNMLKGRMFLLQDSLSDTPMYSVNLGADYTGEQYDIVAETTGKTLPIINELMGAVKSGDTEEVASLMAELDVNAIKKLSESLGREDLLDLLFDLDELSSGFRGLTDKLKAMQGEMENKALAKFKIDLSEVIDRLTLIKKLSETSLNEAFAKADVSTASKIEQMDKFIPIESFRNMYDEILKVENGGRQLANVLDFSQEKGFFFNQGDLEAELAFLRKQLEAYSKVREGYIRLKNDDKTEEYTAKIENLKKVITTMESYGTSLDQLNQQGFQENFLKVWQEASEKVNTYKIDSIAESLIKASEATEDFRESFAKNMGSDFLAMGKQMGLLDTGDISLGRSFEDIKIDDKPIYEYIEAMKQKIATDLEDAKITNLQYQNALKYLKVLPELIRSAYNNAQAKKGKKRKDDDFRLIFLQSEVAIGKTTDALNAMNEKLLKSYEIQKRIKDLQERNPKESGKWYDKAMESLINQQAVIEAQMGGKAFYDSENKALGDRKTIWGATGVDTKVLELNRNYLDILEKTKALELARSDARLKDNADIIKDMEAQLQLEKKQYDIRNKMYALESVGNQAETTIAVNRLKSGGWFQNQADWKANQIMFNSQIEMINQQVEEVAKRITELASQASPSIIESGEIERLQLLRQELELRKELLELQKQANDPSGWEGAKQAFREYAQNVGNDALLMKEAITQSLDTITSGLTDGLYAAMKGTEYNWEQFWDNLAKIFLEKAIEMTVMKGMAAIFNGISGLFGGNIFSGGGGINATSFGTSSIMAGAGSNPFGLSGVKLHAKGGIIKSPTYMMGNDGLHQAGERGAEAIMPLKRLSNGSLGISADGAGGGNVNNNDFSIHITTTGNSGNAEQDRKQAEEMQKMVKLLVNQQIGEFNKREHRQGGMFYNKR